MRKQVKKTGTSLCIILDKEDCDVYDLKAGDIIDIGDLVKIKNKKK